MTKHKHRPCPCGCGELADECMSPRTGLGGAFQLEPGDTGQAILPAPSVKDQGAQWLPEGTDPVWGDVRHHRERIDQLKEWVRYWKAKADSAEGALWEVAEGIETNARIRGDLDDRTVSACAAHVRNLIIDYKIRRDGGYDFSVPS